MSTQISISIYMPTYLAAYFRSHLVVRNKRYYMSTANDVGRMLNSLISYPEGSGRVEPQNTDDELVEIYIPNNPSRINKFSRNFITKTNARRFVDFLKCTFDIEFHNWILIANTMGLKNEFAYELFLHRKKIDTDAKSMEALKKKDYRFRQRIKDQVSESLQSIID